MTTSLLDSGTATANAFRVSASRATLKRAPSTLASGSTGTGGKSPGIGLAGSTKSIFIASSTLARWAHPARQILLVETSELRHGQLIKHFLLQCLCLLFVFAETVVS